MSNQLVRVAFVVGSIASFATVTGCTPRAPNTDGGFATGGGGDMATSSTLTLGDTVTSQDVPPPPISGGTLAILKDGYTAVVADPDRDHIYVVDTKAQTKIADITLTAGDEPGRVLEDDIGRVHVALRRGGAVVTLDPTTWSVAQRREVCPAPRGIAYDSTADVIHVACVGGEFVTLPAASGNPTRTLHLDRDLRDPIILDGQLYVSRFRTAELIPLDSSGNPGTPIVPGTLDGEDLDSSADFTPAAAWRMVAIPNQHTIYMLHQRGTTGTIVTTTPGGYGGSGGGDPCSTSILHSTISAITPSQAQYGVPAQDILAGTSFAVDFAYSTKSDLFAVVAAGNAHSNQLATVIYATRPGGSSGGDDFGFDETEPGCSGQIALLATPGQAEPIAVGFNGDNHIVVQSREPAMLMIPDLNVNVALSSDSKADTGHAVFHSNSGAGLACASCHLEGGEDGRTWSFDTEGLRRTQSIRGKIHGTEPFHWDGSLANFGDVMSEVFVKRMSGPNLDNAQLTAMFNWVDAIPYLPQSAPLDTGAISRGQAIFQDATVGCTTCHNGVKLTNNQTLDVGTQGKFQVPSLLGVGWRAPYLHDGRAATLQDRFDPSLGGGSQHGNTAQLSSDQLSDLIAYLNSI